MGMSTHIVGYRPADEQWYKMLNAWNACTKAGVSPPDEVISFFDDEDPNKQPGKEVSLGDAVQEFEQGYKVGYEVDVELLPKGVKIIRFYNSC